MSDLPFEQWHPDAKRQCGFWWDLSPIACGQCERCQKEQQHHPVVQPPATPQEPEPYGPFFDPCGKCVTRTHCAHHDRCLAECVPADLRTSAPPAVWQDIETAPKDGTPVLLLWFDAETGAAPMHRVGFWHSREQAWCDTHRVLHNQHSHPTHWMPLPSPPTPGEHL